MVLFNYATKELTAKVVYYGPGLCGKTTNLQHIYDTLPGQAKGKMLSLATKTDRTLFFDFLPIDLGSIRGMKTKIQLYTVPGQVFYDTTRKLVLKGADGVVFVADSQIAMADANQDSFENLITNLKEQNLDIKNMPHVLQYNKRDMKNVMTIEELNKILNRYDVPWFEAVAPKGDGVFETLKGISKLVLKNLGQKYGLEEEKDNASKVRSGKMPGLPNPGGTGKLPDLPGPKPAPAAATPKPAPAAPPPPPVMTRPTPPPSIATPPPASPPRKTADLLKKPSFDEPIQFDEDPSGPVSIPAAARKKSSHLEPISTLDDSEVIELEDLDPIEFDELDDMAEIANMARETTVAAEPAPQTVDPIEVPISINLPASLEGKPLRLVIDITFNE